MSMAEIYANDEFDFPNMIRPKLQGGKNESLGGVFGHFFHYIRSCVTQMQEKGVHYMNFPLYPIPLYPTDLFLKTSRQEGSSKWSPL